jgi:hypothetical protein
VELARQQSWASSTTREQDVMMDSRAQKAEDQIELGPNRRTPAFMADRGKREGERWEATMPWKQAEGEQGQRSN